MYSGKNLDFEYRYRTISVEDYTDKVAGGWVGQATGVLYAQDTEFKWVGEIIPFDLDDWYRIKPETIAEARKVLSQGKDPIETARAQVIASATRKANATTFREATNQYITAHSASWRNAIS